MKAPKGLIIALGNKGMKDKPDDDSDESYEGGMSDKEKESIGGQLLKAVERQDKTAITDALFNCFDAWEAGKEE